MVFLYKCDKTMDLIDSNGKDKSLKTSESKLHMRNLGSICILGKSRVVAGGVHEVLHK